MTLKGRRAIILVEADYQDLEVHYPRLRLIEEGCGVKVVGTGTSPTYKGKNGYPVTVDVEAKDVKAADFDCLIIPGGWAPDKLRLSADMIRLTKEAARLGKVIGCICHGGWLMASADIVRGKKLTSYIAIKDDMTHAGAIWSDAEVVVDGKLITSRKPEDLPAFMREIIRAMQG